MNNEVLHILSHDGSKEFKLQLTNALDMVVPNENSTADADQLLEIIATLDSQEQLLQRELSNPAYSENQKVTMKTYIDQLNEVLGPLQNRVNELYQQEQNNQSRESYDSDPDNEAYARSMGMSIRRRGGRKSRRKNIRKSRRSRKSTSRKSRRRRSRKTSRRKY
jgi:hypothetical protein